MLVLICLQDDSVMNKMSDTLGIVPLHVAPVVTGVLHDDAVAWEHLVVRREHRWVTYKACTMYRMP